MKTVLDATSVPRPLRRGARRGGCGDCVGSHRSRSATRRRRARLPRPPSSRPPSPVVLLLAAPFQRADLEHLNPAIALALVALAALPRSGRSASRPSRVVSFAAPSGARGDRVSGGPRRRRRASWRRGRRGRASPSSSATHATTARLRRAARLLSRRAGRNATRYDNLHPGVVDDASRSGGNRPRARRPPAPDGSFCGTVRPPGSPTRAPCRAASRFSTSGSRAARREAARFGSVPRPRDQAADSSAWSSVTPSIVREALVQRSRAIAARRPRRDGSRDRRSGSGRGAPRASGRTSARSLTASEAAAIASGSGTWTSRPRDAERRGDPRSTSSSNETTVAPETPHVPPRAPSSRESAISTAFATSVDVNGLELRGAGSEDREDTRRLPHERRRAARSAGRRPRRRPSWACRTVPRHPRPPRREPRPPPWICP